MIKFIIALIAFAFPSISAANKLPGGDNLGPPASGNYIIYYTNISIDESNMHSFPQTVQPAPHEVFNLEKVGDNAYVFLINKKVWADNNGRLIRAQSTEGSKNQHWKITRSTSKLNGFSFTNVGTGRNIIFNEETKKLGLSFEKASEFHLNPPKSAKKEQPPSSGNYIIYYANITINESTRHLWNKVAVPVLREVFNLVNVGDNAFVVTGSNQVVIGNNQVWADDNGRLIPAQSTTGSKSQQWAITWNASTLNGVCFTNVQTGRHIVFDENTRRLKLSSEKGSAFYLFPSKSPEDAKKFWSGRNDPLRPPASGNYLMSNIMIDDSNGHLIAQTAKPVFREVFNLKKVGEKAYKVIIGKHVWADNSGRLIPTQSTEGTNSLWTITPGTSIQDGISFTNIGTGRNIILDQQTKKLKLSFDKPSRFYLHHPKSPGRDRLRPPASGNYSIFYTTTMIDDSNKHSFKKVVKRLFREVFHFNQVGDNAYVITGNNNKVWTDDNNGRLIPAQSTFGRKNQQWKITPGTSRQDGISFTNVGTGRNIILDQQKKELKLSFEEPSRFYLHHQDKKNHP